jgi:hypothetical protein
MSVIANVSDGTTDRKLMGLVKGSPEVIESLLHTGNVQSQSPSSRLRSYMTE